LNVKKEAVPGLAVPALLRERREGGRPVSFFGSWVNPSEPAGGRRRRKKKGGKKRSTLLASIG